MENLFSNTDDSRLLETFKPQLKRLSKNTLIYGVGGFVNRFIGFLLLPVFTAYLTPTDYGISSILGWVAFLLAPIFSLGFGAAMAPCYFEGNNRERKEETLWTGFTILLISTSLLAIMGIFLSRPISLLAFQTPEYHYLVTIALLSTCLSILSTPFMLRLQFEERARLFVILTLLVTFISVSSSLLLVVVFKKGIRGFIEAGLVSQVANFILFLSPAIATMKFRFCLSLQKDLLRLGIPLIPSFAFLFILQHGNKYILQWIDGLDSLGVYTIGFNLGLVMNLVVSAFQTAWLPFFMSFVDKREEARLLFSRIMTYFIFTCGTLALLFFVTAKPVVVLLTQPAFHESYIVVGLSASAQFLAGVFYILLPGLYFAKEVKYVSVIQAMASLVAVGLNLLLIPLFGMMGAAIALVLGFLNMVFFTHLWNLKRKRKYLQIQYERKRILCFAALFVGYAILMLAERDLSLLGEIAYSLSVMISLPLVMFTLLNPQERRSVINVTNLLRKRSQVRTA